MDYLFGYSCLPGNLDGERTARSSDGELEERAHLMAVVEHRTVGCSRMAFGEVLEILIVRRDYRPDVFLPELAQDRLRNGTADLRLGACSELVDKDERVFGSMAHHDFHVHQVRGIGAEVVLDALFVADVNHDVRKDTCRGTVADRDGQPALEHILQQSHRLQTDRFATGIRPGDNQQMLVLGELYVKRDHRWGYVPCLILLFR